MKLKINPDSGKKNIIISGIGSFKFGAVYELGKKESDICLKKTVKVLNPLNNSQIIEIPIFIEENESISNAKRDNQKSDASKKGVNDK